MTGTVPPEPPPGGSEPAEDAETLDRLRRRVLWALPSGLYVVGSRGEEDGRTRWNLMTANLVQQVATEPKLLAVAVDAAALTHRLVVAGGCFAVSLVARSDRSVVRKFVKPVPADAVELGPDGHPRAMAGVAVHCGPTGAPVLAGAPAWLDCRVRHRLDLGSHGLFVGEVVGVHGPPGDLPELLRMEDTRMSYGG